MTAPTDHRSGARSGGLEYANGGAPTGGGLVDAAAAGALLGVPATWVLAEARADRIPHVRLGKYVRFDPVALEAWWRARVRGPVARTGGQPVSVDGRGQ